MPIAFNPDKVILVSLKSDRDTPESQRPVLLFKALTEAEEEQVFALHDEAVDLEKKSGKSAARAKLKEAIGVGLRGVRNWPTEKTGVDALKDLQYEELWELAKSYPVDVSITPTDLFISASRAPSPEAATAAETATPASPALVENAPLLPSLSAPATGAPPAMVAT